VGRRCAPLALVGALAPFIPLTAHAGPDSYVFTPYVVEGARVVNVSMGTQRHRDGNSDSAESVGLGWNPTQRWFTQVYAGWTHPAGEAANFDAWSWQNQFQLMAGESSPVALGAFFEIERPRDRSEGYDLTWGPMLQFDSANLQTNLNLLLSRYVRTQEAQTTTLSYQWQVKRLWRPHVEIGLQGFGDVGTWDHWADGSQQVHSFGPALFGKWQLGPNRTLRIDGALLVGATSASPRATFRSHAQFEF
jgi:hypothetical protein